MRRPLSLAATATGYAVRGSASIVTHRTMSRPIR
ncbi:MAG: hypothetical protein QOE45_1971 [Frankiaceae bacterium]|jgi:hypothetical protein|nr:hypothetical protein [Frankiaceae bacterium]